MANIVSTISKLSSKHFVYNIDVTVTNIDVTEDRDEILWQSEVDVSEMLVTDNGWSD